jgi:hypothetical protein
MTTLTRSALRPFILAPICPMCGQAKPINIKATVNAETVRNHYTVQLVDRRTLQVDGKRISMIEETEPVLIVVIQERK